MENYLSQGTVHVFPSQCEGSAKVIYEAAACGLPQITTREAGDVVTDGVEGILITPGNVGELASAILELYRHPEAIETALVNDLFVPEDFADLVLTAAKDNASVGKLLRELQEPRPAGQDCIPWLGETAMKERILRLCARGKIAINLRGMEYLQALPGEDEEAAWKRLRPKLSYTGVS